jgi:hypothetical protein
MGLQSYQFNGTRKVNGEHSLIMLVYNIKRTYLGVPDLIAKLKMELTLQAKSCFAKTKYIKLQLDLIFIKLNLQPKKGFLKDLI